MTIEIMSVVTIISVACAVYFGAINAKRNKTQDDKSEATMLTTLNVKQDTMQKSLDEIRFDVKGIRAESNLMQKQMASLEASCKSAHKRIDRIEGIHADE